MTRRTAILAWFAAAAIAPAAGCSSAPAIRVPERIYLDRPVPALSPGDVPQRPPLRTAAELTALDSYRRTHALWASYARAWAYIGELEAAVGICSRIPPPDP